MCCNALIKFEEFIKWNFKQYAHIFSSVWTDIFVLLRGSDYLLIKMRITQCCCFLYQNPVWRATGKESADAEENGRHVDRDHCRPTVLSAAGKTYRSEKVKTTWSSNWSVLDGMVLILMFLEGLIHQTTQSLWPLSVRLKWKKDSPLWFSDQDYKIPFL